VRCDTESLFLLGFSDEEFLAALVMASSGAFFNKLLIKPAGYFARVVVARGETPPLDVTPLTITSERHAARKSSVRRLVRANSVSQRMVGRRGIAGITLCELRQKTAWQVLP
jgi:hypothetical protein